MDGMTINHIVSIDHGSYETMVIIGYITRMYNYIHVFFWLPGYLVTGTMEFD